MKNSKLKAILFEKGKSQRALSKETGISETHLSWAINGRFILTNDQKRKVANALGKQITDIFEV